jgi:predicted amidophosphoribosyltransferase
MSEDVFNDMLEDDIESPYCEKCDSCGETGCCPPIMCEAVKCKYGEINIKDYRCFQDQWSVMYEALKDIKNANSYFLVQELAKNALNEVDNLWDKLYSKEQ